ncbi:hypothetical protein BDP27DRAFT_1487799 [Rhodocollybia butyracea]|uniref:Uncharacterized protein n=1 Tax=Rhodocollybia butyracea TaxID=206335 RepID=A0A9P5Q118_9AGAR|nr:hypothetical protein BDP27DRAFT_1487799 [Rhodocollybia butyracea]
MSSQSQTPGFIKQRENRQRINHPSPTLTVHFFLMTRPSKVSTRSEKRPSSTRHHHDFNKSRSRPVKAVSSDFCNVECTLGMKEAAIKKMLERKQRLLDDPWILTKGEFGPRLVQCAACKQCIRLDPRRQYYTTPWYKHVFRCARIRAHYFNDGQHMPYETLKAEVGYDDAQKIMEDIETGVHFHLTSDPKYRPKRTTNNPTPRARSSGTSTSRSPSRSISPDAFAEPTTPSSSGSSSASTGDRAIGVLPPRYKPKRTGNRPTLRAPSSSTSPSQSVSRSISPDAFSEPTTPSSSGSTSASPRESSYDELDDVPFEETLAYQIGLNLARMRAEYMPTFVDDERRPYLYSSYTYTRTYD